MTYQDVLEFAHAANSWLSSHKDDQKFTYALRKLLKRAKPLIEAYQEQVEDLNIEHAAVNDKGIIQREPNGACAYTKEALHTRNKAIRALVRTDVTLEPHLVDPPAELTEAERSAFAGFVLAPEIEEIEA